LRKNQPLSILITTKFTIMKYILLICASSLCLCLLSCSPLVAQNGKIELIKPRVAKLSETGDILTYKELINTLSISPETQAALKKHKSGRGGANVLGAIGGFMIGWPIGTSLGGGDPEWALLGAGVGLVAVAIPIESKANRNLEEAVNIYNNNIGLKMDKYHSPITTLSVSPTNFGLKVIF